ncbi:MAG: hypothetical protein C0622_07370 [Desulfuromonas sp.]|nr:MAG: hypothetical protein C0622_07370 [Desulfuromonas sp.]
MHYLKNIFILLIILLLSVPFVAAASDYDETTSGDEIRQLTAAVNELVRELKEQQGNNRSVELQKLEIAINYLSFRSRRIEAREEELRDKRRVVESLEDLLAKVEDDEEAWEARFSRQGSDSGSFSSSDEEKEDKLNFAVKQWKDRLDSLNSEILQLEIEIAEMTDELEDFESYVQDRLGILR